MKEQYTIGCPICEDSVEVSIGEARTIYYIEGYENKRSLFGLFGKDAPDESKGANQVKDEEFIEIVNKVCAEKHQINIYHSHYRNTDDEHQLFGPAEEPSVYCPSCSYQLDNHEDHIVRLDSNLSMQYVLRTVSLNESSNFKHSDAVTKKLARQFDQICIPKECPHCGSTVYYNYSSRNLKVSEGFEGIKSY